MKITVTAGGKISHVEATRGVNEMKALYDAMDAARRDRGLTWDQVAVEMDTPRVNGGVLKRLAKGGAVGFPHVMRMVGWLRRPLASFTFASPI